MKNFTAIYGETGTAYSFKAMNINNAIDFVRSYFDESVQSTMCIIDNTGYEAANEGKLVYFNGKRYRNYVVEMRIGYNGGGYVWSESDVEDGGFVDFPCSIEDAVLAEDEALELKARLEAYCEAKGYVNVKFVLQTV